MDSHSLKDWFEVLWSHIDCKVQITEVMKDFHQRMAYLLRNLLLQHVETKECWGPSKIAAHLSIRNAQKALESGSVEAFLYTWPVVFHSPV